MKLMNMAYFQWDPGSQLPSQMGTGFPYDVHDDDDGDDDGGGCGGDGQRVGQHSGELMAKIPE